MEYGRESQREQGLETVRALHQTVVALRAALEESKTEILQLKSKVWPIDSLQEAFKILSLENHVLKQKLLKKTKNNTNEDTEEVFDGVKKEFVVVDPEPDTTPESSAIETIPTVKSVTPRSLIETCTLKESPKTSNVEEPKIKKVTIVTPKVSPRRICNIEARISVKSETTSPRNVSRSLESLTILKSPIEGSNKLSFSKTFSFSNLSSQISREFNIDIDEEMSNKDNDRFNNSVDEQEATSPQNEQEQTEEVDDIELIFTTDDTKDSDFKEQLVSIDAREGEAQTSNLLRLPLDDIDQSQSDREEMEDDVFNDNFENENQENSNFQSFDMKRDNSQLCDSRSDNSINQEKSLKSYYSLQDSSFENRSLEKDESFDRFEERIRIVETDISKCGIHDVEYVVGRRNTCPNPLQYKPLIHREALSKVGPGRKTRPILTQSNAIRKDSGAQTDISALPGSYWRSESSLANKARLGENFTTLPSKLPLPGSRLRLSEKTVEARRVLLSDIGFTSMVPELSRSADHLFPQNLRPTGSVAPIYGQFLKTTDLYSPAYTSQKFTWSATTASPSDNSQTQSHYNSMYPLTIPSRRCSAPVSPSRRSVLKHTPSKVRFANGSLPELRGDWSTVDSGDSTDSLVEEAENYLRRSIDCIIGRETFSSSYSVSRPKTGVRRASAPEPSGDNVPPPGWLPFLPRVSRDLKLDNWVKVITSEGRVKGGRVRYIGPVISQKENFVGVQLSCPDGYCDGTYNNRMYFQCEPYHGIFVPFKKVIMGWRP